MVTVHFFRPRDEAEGPTLGPFEWVQVTYRELRRAPDGEPIAEMWADGDWHLIGVDAPGWSDFTVEVASERSV